MSPARTLDVEVPLESAELAAHVAQALSLERADAPPRTRVDVSAEGAVLRLHIESEDLRGLRAGANSFLRWADVAVGVARSLQD